MRRNLLLPSLLPLLFISTVALANPSFTIGSNPYLTVFAYPHDMLKWPNRAVFLLAMAGATARGTDELVVLDEPGVALFSRSGLLLYHPAREGECYESDGGNENAEHGSA